MSQDEKPRIDLLRQSEGHALLSLDRVSNIIDIPIKTLREMIRLKKPFPVKHIGRRVYVRRVDLEEWLSEL